MAPLSGALGGDPVSFAEDCIGEKAEMAVGAMKEGDVLLLENLRFHAGEEKNAEDFTAALAKLGDVYVNDAFATAHRAHASTEGLARHLPAYAGLLMQAELEALGQALEAPKRPVVAVVGGAKVSTKLELLGNLLPKVDYLIIGGGMANTFLHAQGHEVGKSLAERDLAVGAADTGVTGNGERDAGLERPARRFRDHAIRCRYSLSRTDGGGADRSGCAAQRGRRRRYRCRARSCESG